MSNAKVIQERLDLLIFNSSDMLHVFDTMLRMFVGYLLYTRNRLEESSNTYKDGMNEIEIKEDPIISFIDDLNESFDDAIERWSAFSLQEDASPIVQTLLPEMKTIRSMVFSRMIANGVLIPDEAFRDMVHEDIKIARKYRDSGG